MDREGIERLCKRALRDELDRQHVTLDDEQLVGEQLVHVRLDHVERLLLESHDKRRREARKDLPRLRAEVDGAV